MARRARIRGGTLVVSGSLAIVAACLFPLQAAAQDNSGLATQVLITQADLPSSYSPVGQLLSGSVSGCTGGNALASTFDNAPGSNFNDPSQYPLVNAVGSGAFVGNNISETEAAFNVVGSQAFETCLYGLPQGSITISNLSVSQLPDPGVGDQSSEFALSFTNTNNADGTVFGFSGDVLWIRVGQIVGALAFQTAQVGTTQGPGLQFPADLQTQLINLFVSRMQAAQAQIPPAIPRPIVSSGAAAPNRPAAIAAPVSVVVFVHGIRSGCDEPGTKSYQDLFAALVKNKIEVYSFCYEHDKAFSRQNWNNGLNWKNDCFSQITTITPVGQKPIKQQLPNLQLQVLFDPNTGPLYRSQDPNVAKNITTFEGNSAYDTDGPLAYDATKLDDCLSQLVKAGASGANNIALIVNSMGGAIGRGWLALAPEVNSLALTKVTTFITLEGAMEGSYVARIGQHADTGLASIPGLGPSIATDAEFAAGKAADLNSRRPGVKDLDPQSGWYRSLVANGEPPKLHYYTFSTDLVFHITTKNLWSSQTSTIDPFGDGVMELGSADSYQSLSILGGSSFLPGGPGVDKHQYIITGNYNYTLQLSATFGNPFGYVTSVPGLLGTFVGAIIKYPYGHFNFGDQIGKGQPITSCDARHVPTSIPGEIVRILGKPAAACSSS